MNSNTDTGSARLSQKNRVLFSLSFITLLSMLMLIWAVLFRMFTHRDESHAAINAESIATKIQDELQRCLNTTELLSDLYSVYGDKFLNDFELICAELSKDDLAIGSMYFAPNAVIQYAYPDKVDEATRNFEMLKDPIQGPKAQMAIDFREATIAGPHALIEGGEGFIIRNPIYDEEGQFIAFTIMVIDKRQMVDQILNSLSEEESSYNICISKKEDKTALYESGNYIITNGCNITQKRVTIDFPAPNDTWYLTIEPKAGWSPWGHLVPYIIGGLFFLFIFAQLLYYFLRSKNQTELHSALESAEAASRSKSKFLFNLSHDIRTPMNAISGFTNLLSKSLDDPVKAQEYIQKIQASNEFLLSLINNVLDMTRIENGKLKLNEAPQDFTVALDGIASVFSGQFETKQITFESNFDVKHRSILCDISKIRQIYLNLLSNAVKYTPEGGTIRFDVREITCDNPRCITLQATISDTGVGIAKDLLPYIFDEEADEKGKIIGNGLDLPFVKKLVELMHGTIEVKSQEGKGSTFIVTHTHHIAKTQKAAAEAAADASDDFEFPDYSGRRILIAEDNDLNAEIASTILEQMGIEVERTEDGRQCVDKLSNSEPGYYNLILMDIQMPVMDGYAATRAIRSLPDAALARIPIIAMTANAFSEDRKNAYFAGMNSHLAKPLDVPRLIELLDRHLK